MSDVTQAADDETQDTVEEPALLDRPSGDEGDAPAAAEADDTEGAAAAAASDDDDAIDDDATDGDDDAAAPDERAAAARAAVLSPDDAADLVEDGAADADADAAPSDVEAPAWLAAALEALVFAAPEPLTAARLREVLFDEGHDFPLALVKQTMRTLVVTWSAEEKTVGAGLRLVETGAGFAFRTAPQAAQFLRRVFQAKPQRLSRAALETLAIIAYRQPVTRPQVDEIRGVDSAGALKNLLDRKLIRVLGKADDVGRPLIYGTTRAFLDFFQLRSLSDLPTLKEYQDLKGGVGAPEALPTPTDAGPVTVMDLFDPLGSGELVSNDTEAESAKALAALENALGQATQVTARALAFEKGEVAIVDAMERGPRFTIDDEVLERPVIDAPSDDEEGAPARAAPEVSPGGVPEDAAAVEAGAADPASERGVVDVDALRGPQGTLADDEARAHDDEAGPDDDDADEDALQALDEAMDDADRVLVDRGRDSDSALSSDALIRAAAQAMDEDDAASSEGRGDDEE